MASGQNKWRPWGGPTTAAPGSDLSGTSSLDLIDITLVTDVTGTETEVPHLGLAFADGGMTVRRSDGSDVVTIPWVSIVELSADVEPQRYAGLSTRVALDVQSNRRRHRFLVPNVTPQALTGSLGAMSTRYGRGELVSTGAKGKRRGR
jgi:hypothetical protein